MVDKIIFDKKDDRWLSYTTTPGIDEFNTPLDSYEDFLTVEQLLSSDKIDKYYHQFFKPKCDVCNSPLMISKSLAIMQCQNIRCSHNLPKYLERMAESFSLKNLGYKSCELILANSQKLYLMGKKSHLSLFVASDISNFSFELQNRSIFYDFLELRKKVLTENISFCQFIGKLGLPAMGSNMSNILKGMSYLQFIDYFNKYGVRDGLYNLDCNNIEIHRSLETFFDDIKLLGYLRQKNFKETNKSLPNLEYICSGRLTFNNQPTFEESFHEEMKKIFEKSVNLVKRNSSKSSCDWIVSNLTSTSKARAGLERGNLVTPDEFFKILLINEESKYLLNVNDINQFKVIFKQKNYPFNMEKVLTLMKAIKLDNYRRNIESVINNMENYSLKDLMKILKEGIDGQ